MGLFRKGKTPIIAKFHSSDYSSDLVICSHSREGKILSCSLINMIGQGCDTPINMDLVSQKLYNCSQVSCLIRHCSFITVTFPYKVDKDQAYWLTGTGQ